VTEPRPGVVLDSSAVIALFLDEPSAGEVERLLRAEAARISTVNAAETVDILVRVYGGSPDEVAASLEHLCSTSVEAVPPTLEQAERAGELRARLFERGGRRVSLADCFVLAAAGPAGRVATGDRLLARLARDEGLEAVLLGA
jgi:PIN domain nuclease of toxin-antitoxin system